WGPAVSLFDSHAAAVVGLNGPGGERDSQHRDLGRDGRTQTRPGCLASVPSEAGMGVFSAASSGVAPDASEAVVSDHRLMDRPTVPRVLFVSGSIGLGHAARDLAIARELRRLLPSVQLEWLAGDPA